MSTEQVDTDIPLPTEVPDLPPVPQRRHTGWWIAALVLLLLLSVAAGGALLWLARGQSVQITQAESVGSFGEGFSKVNAKAGHTLWVVTYQEPAGMALAAAATLIDATGEAHEPGMMQTTVVDGQKQRTVSLIYGLPDGRKPVKIRVGDKGDLRFGKGRVPARLCSHDRK